MKEKESKPISQGKFLLKKNFKLSKHFSFYELTETMYDKFQKANRKLTDKQVEKLIQLCETILEPIRKYFRLPITVTSGYRCQELNDYIGGSETSQHNKCEAADIIINGLDDMEGSLHVWEWVYMKSGIKFGQLIHEYVRSGNPPTFREKIWLHISLGEPHRARSRSRQVYKYRKLGQSKGLYLPVPNPHQRPK